MCVLREGRTGDLRVKAAQGEFWTAVIPGDDAVIEMWTPPRAKFPAELSVSGSDMTIAASGRS